MMTRTRYVVLALAIIISLHYILSFSHEGYGHATSLDTLKGQLPWRQPPPEGAAEGAAKVWHEPPYKTPASAVIVLLARNGDLGGMVKSVSQLENKFNHKFGYPYVFLNEEPFTDEFKRYARLVFSPRAHSFVLPSLSAPPASIDEAKAAASRKNMEENLVLYGGSVPYRNMCRFNSGFFYRHELLKPYRYYWRVDPDVKFFCDLDYDPFLFMQDEGKKYGFTISLPEYQLTIPTLWDAVKGEIFRGLFIFLRRNRVSVVRCIIQIIPTSPSSSLPFAPFLFLSWLHTSIPLPPPARLFIRPSPLPASLLPVPPHLPPPYIYHGPTHTLVLASAALCIPSARLPTPSLIPPSSFLILLAPSSPPGASPIPSHTTPSVPSFSFWSNFEIADLDLWRSEPYSKFFDFLDSKGGFYYERWGDAPVHSIGAALFARKDQIHFFEDIGYRHEPFQHCPQGAAHTRGRCECDVGNNFGALSPSSSSFSAPSIISVDLPLPSLRLTHCRAGIRPALPPFLSLLC
ncbi:nucleotide-diphospho-sugar transferase [Mycena sp. CBHHK59/15]|nr:nucleotide-diphospho-sugar transferase [Mycena sp. CBHHK59/15]